VMLMTSRTDISVLRAPVCDIASVAQGGGRLATR
jgi:hypothetical protein